MSFRFVKLLVVLSATWLLAGSSALANNQFGTPASFVIDDKPKSVAIDVVYVVHRPRDFPGAIFLVEFRRKDFGDWKRSIGKAKFRIEKNGAKTLTVSWTSGFLKGESAVLDIESSSTAKWMDGESEREHAFDKPLFNQKFDVMAERLPEAISSRLASMQTTSLHQAILDFGGI
ncbi:MAG: hypothetical protein AAGJ83_06575 [Planctomycetota bacterium]